jgi:hypothetical protein
MNEIKLSKTQIQYMQHANKSPNFSFYCSSDDTNWNELIALGFAIQLKGWKDGESYFQLTEKGREFLRGL